MRLSTALYRRITLVIVSRAGSLRRLTGGAGDAPRAPELALLHARAAAETTRAVMKRFYRELGADPGVARVPTWALRFMGLFNPSVRELVEMLYQWEQPYTVDDTRIRREFGLTPTPWDDAVAATVAWGRAAYGA